MRAIFLCAPSRAFGEINTLMPLARDIVTRGGDVWFLASPLAATIARTEFEPQTFAMNGDRAHNRIVLARMLRKFNPDLLVFADFYEIIRPQRKAECPLIDADLLEILEDFRGVLTFVDFIAHAPALREIGECPACARLFGGRALIRFLSRLFVVLPCPLNDPDPTEDQCGIPYRWIDLPRRLSSAARARMRARFLSDPDDYLVLRTGSTWQSKLAERLGVGLYQHLGSLLAFYLGGLPRPVTLVSVSSAHQLKLPEPVRGFRICNIPNLSPQDFEQLVLAADLVLTDNEIAHTLCRTIGRVPGVVLVNSYEADELLDTIDAEPVRRVVGALERQNPGSVYPYKVFPIRAHREELEGWNDNDPSGEQPSMIRLGRMRSSPFTRAEIYGGEETREQLRRILCDRRQRRMLAREDASYIARVNALQDGASVLNSLARHGELARHCAL